MKPIDINERTPEHGEEVIFTDGKNVAIGVYFDYGDDVAGFDGACTLSVRYTFSNVTHWLPISELHNLFKDK